MKNPIIKMLSLAFFLEIFIAKAGPQEDLVAACMSGNLEAAKIAIAAGAQVNALDANGNPAIASAFYWPEITKLLLEKGADPNLGAYPAIINASSMYSTEVLKLLLDAGADPNKPGITDPGATMKTLIAKEKEKGKDANQALIKAWEGIAKTSKPTEVYVLQTTVLGNNCVPCLEMLFVKGAKPEKAVTDGSLLHTFATYGSTKEYRKQNIDAAKTSMESYGYKTPEWYSSDLPDNRIGTHEEMMKVLLGAGLKINEKNKAGQTPLKIAIAGGFGKEEIIRLFIKNGADVKETGMSNDPTPFTKETQSVDNVKVTYDFPREGRHSDGGGYSANMELLKTKPKKVALISYYLYDPGKGKVSGGVYTGNVSMSVWRTPDMYGQIQANGFYGESIDALKNTFKENGIDLLTPDEYLDTQEKTEFYYGFNPETAKKEKTTITKRGAAGSNVGEAGAVTASTLKVAPAGKGYRTFFVANERPDESWVSNFQEGIFSANRKMTTSLGYDLAKGLDVDAVLVVYVCTRKIKRDKDDFAVNAVVAMMMGPNPGKTEETDKDAKNLGQFYCGTRTTYSNPLVFKEEKGIFGQYEGMSNVMKAHVNKMCHYVNGKEKD